MPLHLLHHKSWNVYSSTNIEKVRADEAAAAAAEKAASNRAATAAADDRIEALRRQAEGGAGESPPQISRCELPRAPQSDAPITTSDGHINLFPAPAAPRREPNADHERERKAAEEKIAAQFNMKLSRPADPWYVAADRKDGKQRARDTERGRVKEEKRKNWGDPLRVIKRGVSDVREVGRERERWREERERDVGGVGHRRERERERENSSRRSRSPDRREERKRRRSKSPDRREGRKKRSGSSHRRRRSRSREKEKYRSREEKDGPKHHGQLYHARGSADAEFATLKEERDRREAQEREKARLLVQKESEARTPGWKPASGGRYSSQFGIGNVRQ